MSPVYWSVTKFAPCASTELLSVNEKDETFPDLDENETFVR